MRKEAVKFANKDKSLFFPVLRERIDSHFKESQLPKQGDHRLVWKGIFMLALLLIPYGLIVSNQFSAWTSLLFAVLMGFGISGVGMSVMHDANHGSFSSVSWINSFFSACLYLLGGNVLNWKIQHNTLHHTYTNIHDVDEDITGKFLLRLSQGDKLRKMHRYQHVYAFLLYGLMTISFFVKDFRQAYKYNHSSGKLVKPFTKQDVNVLVASKLFYVLFIAVVPLTVTDFTFGQWLLGFLAMHFTAGVVLSTIFQLAHVVEGAEQPLPDTNGVVSSAWAIHQLQTTANFSCPRLLSWFIGGLDFQIEHHLFPNISHIHYRTLSPIVQRTAEEYGIVYNNKESFPEALNSHVRMLKALGN
ncbi:fatty acid desaturase family protein [Spirosoma soli]|uniref:Fatty acid desaturase family protein n=1 Tax=Spirosoma soli TaxID=1770529 RepID=A0ABW5LY14_9BACT